MLTKYHWHGKQIDMTSDNTTITSNNFSVDKYGNMTCRSGNFSGKVNIGGDENNPEFHCADNDMRIIMWPGNIIIEDDIYEIDTYIQKGSIAFINRDGTESSYNDYGIRSIPIYNSTASGSANVRIDSYGFLHRATGSSIRWKKDITENIEERLNPQALYKLKIKQFKYKDDYLNKDDKRYGKNILGFIAEDVKEVYEPAVDYDEDGNVEMWNSDVMIPAMLKLIQEQHKDIQQLQNEIKMLKQKQ